MCVFVALFIQYANRMRHMILLPVTSPTLSYLSTLSHKWHDFREKKTRRKLLRTINISIFSTNFV